MSTLHAVAIRDVPCIDADRGRGRGYAPCCSCGWEGPAAWDKPPAVADATVHLVTEDAWRQP